MEKSIFDLMEELPRHMSWLVRRNTEQKEKKHGYRFFANVFDESYVHYENHKAIADTPEEALTLALEHYRKHNRANRA